MIKVGVIGAGSMGRHHVRIYSGMKQCQLVGVADPDAAKAELAQEYGAEYFSDHRGLLELEPELVTIAATTSAHYELACDALAAGCHLLIEKPVTDDLDAARELIRRAEEAGRIIAVGHVERFNPAVTELKRMIDAGELGELLTINNLRVGPYHGRTLDTGIVLDLGTHDVDLISYLLGSRATSVFATAISRKHKHEDHAVLLLTFPGMRTGIIETSWLAPYRARNIFLVGTEHFALCDLINQLILVYEDNPDGQNLLARLRTVPPGEPLQNELESVVASVQNGTKPVCSAEDSVYALSVCLAALKSIATGQAVAVG
ncbi:Gfo/Idh/MocA family oxidoreductase [bacterium]|nr:Gfo/Idh/MocA family oxidoreductase [bacterium]